MRQRFFGNPNSPLFGVYHPPRVNPTGPIRAAIICPPIGQEYLRSHWCLRLLAKQLSRFGVHVFRLDYQGIGDSGGSVEHVQSPETWVENVHEAVEHLREQSGAESVMLIGLRFGAILAAKAAAENENVNSMVLWEPVTDGSNWLSELRQMHHEMLDLWVCKMSTPNDLEREEILGSRYSRSLLDKIEQLRLSPEALYLPQLIVKRADSELQFSHPEPSLQRIVETEDDNAWIDLQALETAWLRPKTTRNIAKTLEYMWTRLEKFGLLDAKSKVQPKTPRRELVVQ